MQFCHLNLDGSCAKCNKSCTKLKDISLNCFKVDSLARLQISAQHVRHNYELKLKISNWDQLEDKLTWEQWTDVEATDSYSCSY